MMKRSWWVIFAAGIRCGGRSAAGGSITRKGGEDGLHHQVGEHVEGRAVEMRHLVQQRQVGGQVVGDALAQAGDGLADRQRAAVLLAGEEEELRAVGADRVEEDAHRGVDQPAQFELVAAHRAQGGAEGLVDLGDQRQAEPGPCR